MPLLSVVRSNGGEFFSDDFRTLTLNTPENIQAIQMIADLMLVHHVIAGVQRRRRYKLAEHR